ncbi:ferrous iron transport protein B [Desulfitispora alkaliphila]|uniref:FeoB small GTPase domain-containing protein n=1 Tax=Desulfitispora alkaliphila TaxID=622674 RepID=UPI003D1D60F9
MGCHDEQGKEPIELEDNEIKILLMGNPNVGKSVVFSKLTGMEVLTANYAGSTVNYTVGKVNYRGKKATLIDVPGTYSLESTSPAEEVAVRLLREGAHVVLCVLDATNLERNLNLALQLKQLDVPIVYALNLIDVAERKGITIDVPALEKELGAPVVPTVAVRNIGLQQILQNVWEVAADKKIKEDEQKIQLSQSERWQKVGEIAENVQKVEHRHPTFWEKMGDAMIRPFPGLPIAIFVLIAAMGLVVGGGKALRAVILLPIFDGYVSPFITAVVSSFVPEGMLRNILVGEFGMLIKGIEWPIALILPYVALFYIVMSFLEDSGYLPRLGVLLDNVMRKMGVQGGNIVPMFMGYGCAVPAILGTRAATSSKERVMITGLVAIAVPCTAQTGAFIALLGDHSLAALIFVYMLSFIAMFTAGLIMSKMIPGKVDPMLLEIPNLLRPDPKALAKKIWLRIKQFLLEAEVPMILGIGFAALIAETGVLNIIAGVMQPFTEGWLGLPGEASLALMLGIIRRELAVLPLLELDLSLLQLIVGSTVALFYLPCLTVMAIIVKEFTVKFALYLMGLTLFLAFGVAGLINHIGQFIATLL